VLNRLINAKQHCLNSFGVGECVLLVQAWFKKRSGQNESYRSTKQT